MPSSERKGRRQQAEGSRQKAEGGKDILVFAAFLFLTLSAYCLPPSSVSLWLIFKPHKIRRTIGERPEKILPEIAPSVL
jgi:hypothetical protein